MCSDQGLMRVGNSISQLVVGREVDCNFCGGNGGRKAVTITE